MMTTLPSLLLVVPCYPPPPPPNIPLFYLYEISVQIDPPYQSTSFCMLENRECLVKSLERLRTGELYEPSDSDSEGDSSE